jgi:hypothetical protein
MDKKAKYIIAFSFEYDRFNRLSNLAFKSRPNNRSSVERFRIHSHVNLLYFHQELITFSNTFLVYILKIFLKIIKWTYTIAILFSLIIFLKILFTFLRIFDWFFQNIYDLDLSN